MQNYYESSPLPYHQKGELKLWQLKQQLNQQNFIKQKRRFYSN